MDWESLLLAPRERDLRSFEELPPAAVPDPAMLQMFDLEWRLDEIQQYADWLRGRHSGGDDDVIALGGLREELQRV